MDSSTIARPQQAGSQQFNRQQLQALIELLSKYDLSVDSKTDNSDLSARLRALSI